MRALSAVRQVCTSEHQHTDLTRPNTCPLLLLALQVMRDRETSASRGYAFITYVNAGDAEAAMATINGTVPPGPYQGRPIRVSASNKSR